MTQLQLLSTIPRELTCNQEVSWAREDLHADMSQEVASQSHEECRSLGNPVHGTPS